MQEKAEHTGLESHFGYVQLPTHRSGGRRKDILRARRTESSYKKFVIAEPDQETTRDT